MNNIDRLEDLMSDVRHYTSYVLPNDDSVSPRLVETLQVIANILEEIQVRGKSTRLSNSATSEPT